ncbi:PREDICTED: uncharacterized protein LOC105360125 [Ceratosolen solmsi marchali]|uniref:Uncharacterized protein LOC105360125 n=1 Tax=Ceratosolen solmsi marchali TaxID=326594 RepID=A0AAJ6VMC3_9HYME|nr:PREDICTED: uncharacterized protein LOC105360125 [Ceratosolen solmsi marchali]
MMETVDVTILSRNACEQRLQVFFQRNCRIPVNNLCAAADPVALMSKGNSGSPVLYNGQLIGIHKATSPSNLAQYSPGKVNLFVSVDYYREYITDVLQNHT